MINCGESERDQAREKGREISCGFQKYKKNGLKECQRNLSTLRKHIAVPEKTEKKSEGGKVERREEIVSKQGGRVKRGRGFVGSKVISL